MRALARYVVHNDRRASTLLGDYIERHQHIIRQQQRRPRQMNLRTAGRYHDLQAIFDRLNVAHFAGGLEARITWGPVTARGKRRRSIKMGSFAVEDRIIRIHPALDQDCVPDYFVAWIVYHEMLHGKHEVRRENGRRRFHSAEFLAEERSSPNTTAPAPGKSRTSIACCACRLSRGRNAGLLAADPFGPDRDVVVPDVEAGAGVLLEPEADDVVVVERPVGVVQVGHLGAVDPDVDLGPRAVDEDLEADPGGGRERDARLAVVVVVLVRPFPAIVARRDRRRHRCPSGSSTRYPRSPPAARRRTPRAETPGRQDAKTESLANSEPDP